MRKIKFRAKAIGSGRWLYGDLVWTGSQRTEPHIIEDWSADEDSATSVDEHTLGMNTGLFDKNHKEIFLGDILAHNEVVIGHVTEWPGQYMLMYYPFIGFTYNSEVLLRRILLNKYGGDVEIVGNIYDNPELVKEDEQ